MAVRVLLEDKTIKPLKYWITCLLTLLFPGFPKAPTYLGEGDPHSIPAVAVYPLFLLFGVCDSEIHRNLRPPLVPADTFLLQRALCSCSSMLTRHLTLVVSGLSNIQQMTVLTKGKSAEVGNENYIHTRLMVHCFIRFGCLESSVSCLYLQITSKCFVPSVVEQCKISINGN